MKSGIALSLLILSQSALAVWDFAGFSGENNQIKINGDKRILEEVYPEEESFVDSKKNCLGKETETDKGHQKFIKKFFANKTWIQPANCKTTRIRAWGVAGKPCIANVQSVQYLFENTTEATNTYKALKNKFSQDENYALVTSDKTVLVINRPVDIPRRGFLQFVKGLDHGLNKTQ